MLEVMFTKSAIPEIKSFQKMSLQDACKLTYRLEQGLQEQQNIIHVDFHILDQNSEEMYAGTLSLGSGYASHLYEHVENKLSSMEMDEEQEKQKEALLKLMAQGIEEFLQEIAPPEEIEKPEEKTRGNGEQQAKADFPLEEENGNKKHLFHIIGGAIGGIVVGAVSVFSLYTVPSNPVEARTSQPDTHLVKGLQQASIQQYPKAIQEFEKLDYKELDKESQKAVLFSYLLSGKANKALQYEPKFAESVVSYYVAIDNLKKVNEIQVKNDVIDFEKAVLAKKDEEVVRLKDKVSVDGRREQSIVDAYLRLKKYEDCFTFAKAQGNKSVMKQVKEVEKKEVEQSTVPDEEKKKKIENIDKVLKEI
ncbi:LPD25 domain-containing protein [Bacillus cereus]|uniref:LPD25 domain-containing protein n=1 Tax=Bacillus cereus TaxID=1396 RepID=UPI001ABF923F|nr:LPD25 domain-containing protein [Bacillus cereus]